VIIYPLITLVLHFPVLFLWSFIFRSCIFGPPNDFYIASFTQLVERWKHSVELHGDYVEK